jgi:Manganese containing catalase
VEAERSVLVGMQRRTRWRRPHARGPKRIAAEEFGHIELVAAAINTMLTDPAQVDAQAPDATLAKYNGIGNPHHLLAGGKVALPQDSRGLPWTGENVFSSGDVVEDLTQNYFLETGARNGKLKVYQMVDHPAARALTGYLLVRRRRPPGRLRPRAGEPHRRRHDEGLPGPADPDRQDPRVPATHRGRPAPHALPLLDDRLPRDRRGLQRSAPRDRRGPDRTGRPAGGRAAQRPAAVDRRLRPRLRARGIAEIAQRLRKTGKVANEPEGVMDKLKDVVAEAKDSATS